MKDPSFSGVLLVHFQRDTVEPGKVFCCSEATKDRPSTRDAFNHENVELKPNNISLSVRGSIVLLREQKKKANWNSVSVLRFLPKCPFPRMYVSERQEDGTLGGLGMPKKHLPPWTHNADVHCRRPHQSRCIMRHCSKRSSAVRTFDFQLKKNAASSSGASFTCFAQRFAVPCLAKLYYDT